MITPSNVRKERSLLRRRACTATANTSPKDMLSGLSWELARGARLRSLPALLFDFDLHPLPFFQGAQRLEGSGDDLLTFGEAFQHFHFQLARQPQADRKEARLPLLDGIDACLGLDPPGRGLLLPRGVADDYGGERNGENPGLRACDHVGRDREAGPGRLGRVEDLHTHF